VEAFTTLLGLLLVILAVLAGAVLHLFLNQRNFQRVDYARLLDQEERHHVEQTRQAQLEQLVGDLARLEQRRRHELESLIERAEDRLESNVCEAKQRLIGQLLAEPRQLDGLLCASSGVHTVPLPLARPVSDPANPQLLRFLRNPRQLQIAELLERGMAEQEVAHSLGLSGHEVELVSAIIFSARVA
jgi:hypothetical protein